MIGGHSKFLLVTGSFWIFPSVDIQCIALFTLAKDDKSYSAIHSSEIRTGSAVFWALAFFLCCRIPVAFFSYRHFLFTSGCFPDLCFHAAFVSQLSSKCLST